MDENGNLQEGTSKARLVIVEDEGIIAWDLRSRLESFGYEVAAVADSGEQALIVAAESGPDLVLMDIKLKGGLDGIEVAERLRATQGIPVIYLTAHSDGDLLRRAKVTEPLGYLLKPYPDRELKIAVEIALFKARVEHERAELTRKLERSLDEVRTLRGLIPICSWCRKVRTDEGFWLSVEEYIQQNTNADWTHSICPTCYDEQKCALNA